MQYSVPFLKSPKAPMITGTVTLLFSFPTFSRFHSQDLCTLWVFPLLSLLLPYKLCLWTRMALLGATKLVKQWLTHTQILFVLLALVSLFLIQTYNFLMFSQISRIPDVLGNFWAKRCSLSASIYSRVCVNGSLFWERWRNCKLTNAWNWQTFLSIFLFSLISQSMTDQLAHWQKKWTNETKKRMS